MLRLPAESATVGSLVAAGREVLLGKLGKQSLLNSVTAPFTRGHFNIVCRQRPHVG